MLLSCARYTELVASSFAFASAFRFCTMASSSSVDMESASRGADVNDETVDLLLGLDVDTDCSDVAKLSDDVRSGDEFVLMALFAVEAFSLPSAGENSSEAEAASLNEAGASLELPEAWNVDACFIYG